MNTSKAAAAEGDSAEATRAQVVALRLDFDDINNADYGGVMLKLSILQKRQRVLFIRTRLFSLQSFYNILIMDLILLYYNIIVFKINL